MSKLINFDLNADVVSVYDKTKTTIYDGVFQKTINSNLVLGPALNDFLDVFTDAASTPSVCMEYTPNNRLFVMTAFVSGVATIAMYNFDSQTGVNSYVGKISVTVPNAAATTHTNRSFKVLDNAGTTGWKILIGTTATVIINGGVFMVNKIDLSDFGHAAGTTFPMASTLAVSGGSVADQKAVYFLQDSAALGVSHVQSLIADFTLDRTNSILYSHNGTATTHQFYKYDLSVAPNVAGGVKSATITIATPGVITSASHGYLANDPVILVTTGALPTGLVAGTVYFVRNPTTNTFELSATTGGASISTTGTQSGTHSVLRAFGTCSANYILKTGNLPALTGSLLYVNAGSYANPTYLPANTALQGVPCAFFGTSTNFYMGKLSELTSGATTWPSLTTANLLGTTNQFITPTCTFMGWSNELNTCFAVTNGSIFIAKYFQNNAILALFGAVDLQYLEGFPAIIPNFGAAALSGIDVNNKWVFGIGSTTGQRGIFASPIGASSQYGLAKIISKVVQVDKAQAINLSTIEELYDISSTTTFYYRTAPLVDTMFDTDSGGWIAISQATNLASVYLDEAVQIKVESWDLMSALSSNAAQISELELGIIPLNEMSDYWVGSVDNTTGNGISPAYTSFRLIQAYATSVPTLYFRAYDDNHNLVASADTVTNPTLFQYSTNNGTTWNALETIPNTPDTTEIRYAWSLPSGVNVTCSLRET